MGVVCHSYNHFEKKDETENKKKIYNFSNILFVVQVITRYS
jgi:hypothetical protein